MLMVFLGAPVVFYLLEYDSKLTFLKDQKIKRLLSEQKNIMETLPDGLIIYQQSQEDPQKNNQLKSRHEIQVQYLNSTFKQMFMQQSMF